MSYLVLARKYRPQRFAELVGQDHVARTLTNAIAQNRVHHAFLFTGARGVGKTSAARILAKALCCAEGPTATPCGRCEFCQEIASGRSVDVMEIDGASNTGVDDVRTLREGARYMPAKGKRKIYIIDEVHMLSTSAFNALLKTLEEPPAHVVFIFATTEAHKIPTTILSRCQRYDFKLIPTAALTSHLEGILAAESIPAEPEAVRLVAREAAGSVRDALSLLDQVIAYIGEATLTADVASEVLGIADRRLLLEMAAAVLDHDAGAALRILSRAADRGVDLGQLARAFLGTLRDLEIVSRVAEPSDLLDATADELSEARALCQRAPAGVLGVLFDRWARAVDEASRSQTTRLILEMAVVDLCQAEPLEPMGDLLQRLEDLEGRLRSGTGVGPGPAAPTRPRPPAPGPASPAAPQGSSSPPPHFARSAAQPAAAAIPTAAAAPAPANTPAGAAAPVLTGSPAEVWRAIRAGFEQRRPRLAALLAHAEVGDVGPGHLILVFPDRFAADQAEKARTEIEQALSGAFGRPMRLTLGHGGSGSGGAPVPGEGRGTAVRSEVREEADAAAADRRDRETEARQHPTIRKAQDLFGASLKEIKT
jgi:DNA polymerase-3 subunit gamma/tau